jgi:hypothetical protein
MDRDSEHLISEATPGLDPTAGNFDLARQFTGQAAAPGLSAKDMERQRAAAEMPPPGAAAHTRAPGPCTSPAPPPNRSSRTPAVSQPQAPSADWRDTVIETGRQAWQPRVVQPYAPFPSPPQVNGPEIGG